MKGRKLISLMLAALLMLAAVPTGAEKAEETAAAQSSSGIKLIDEEREVDQSALDAIIDYNRRSHEMKERTKELVTRSEDPVFGSARLIAFSKTEPDLTGAIDCVSGFSDRWLIQYASPEEAEAAFKRLDADESIRNVIPDALVKCEHDLRDNDFVSYGYDYVHADLLTYENWLASVGNGVFENTVAVLDTGVNGSHPVFGSSVTAGWDFVNSDSDPTDDQGHGTHVAGIIAQGGFAINIMPLKVLGSDGIGSTDDILSAMSYATNAGCSVMNMSLSAHYDDPASDPWFDNEKEQYDEAIDEAFDAGTIVVVAAGNDGDDVAKNLPSCCERACTVGGHNSSYGWYTNSNRGEEVDLTAAATVVYSANYQLNPVYVAKTGTSMATPHVSAACALLRGYRRWLDADAVVRMIKEATVDIGLTGGGTGALNIANLVRQLSDAVLPQTPASPSVSAAIDSTGANLGFITQGHYPMYSETQNGITYARSGNAGHNNSVSAVTVSVNASAGTSLVFNICYETEANYDHVYVYVDGYEVYEFNGSSSGAFEAHVINFTDAGRRTITWVYKKDGSVDTGFDGFKLRNLRINSGSLSYVGYATNAPYIGQQYYLNYAANLSLNKFFITSAGDYPFTDVTYNGSYHVRSGNMGVHNSVSELKFTVYLQAGEKITFDRFVGSESNYDIYKLLVNGAVIEELSGEHAWSTVTYTAATTRNYTFVLRFTKDGSQSANGDCVRIDNIRFIGNFVTGDANGDGSVDIPDALMVLRAAMGLIPVTSQISGSCDVDGTPGIGIPDALKILRYAMGLISSL